MSSITRRPKFQRRRMRAQRGANVLAIAAGVVVVLLALLVVFLLLRKPSTPVVGVQANPSVSAGPTATPEPSTPPPTEAPTATPRPTPTPPTTAAFVSLNAPQRVACKGQSTIYPHMTWSVVNATGISISIDLPGGVFATYGASGASDQQDSPVPFSCSGSFKHTYYFATVGSVGPVSTRKVVITATP